MYFIFASYFAQKLIQWTIFEKVFELFTWIRNGFWQIRANVLRIQDIFAFYSDNVWMNFCFWTFMQQAVKFLSILRWYYYDFHQKRFEIFLLLDLYIEKVALFLNFFNCSCITAFELSSCRYNNLGTIYLFSKYMMFDFFIYAWWFS